MKYVCKTHNVTLIVEGYVRKYGGLKWSGSPQCVLLTMKDPKAGKYGDCEVTVE